MSRTPIPDHLIHNPEEVEKNAKLFDAFVNLIPENYFSSFENFQNIRELIASQLLENIKQKVEREEKVLLPFSLVIRRDS